MNVFVTGGTGFVGKPFVKTILEKGWHVTIIMRDIKKADLFTGDNLKVYEGNVADKEIIDQIAKKEKSFDAVFHLAASLNYFGEKKEIYKDNVQGTSNILNLAINTSSKKFIYASSIEAVGSVTSKEVPAATNITCRPVSTYGETKVEAENKVKEMAKKHFPYAILRLGNVYGINHVSFIVEIAEAILTRNRLLEFLHVYGDRYIQPVYNNDVTDGIIAAFKSQASFVTATLAGEYVTILELFELCSNVLGVKFRVPDGKKIDKPFLILRQMYGVHRKKMDIISYLMTGSGKRIHRACSTEELTKEVGFSPKVSLKTGIEKTLQWAKKMDIIQF